MKNDDEDDGKSSKIKWKSKKTDDGDDGVPVERVRPRCPGREHFFRPCLDNPDKHSVSHTARPTLAGRSVGAGGPGEDQCCLKPSKYISFVTNLPQTAKPIK